MAANKKKKAVKVRDLKPSKDAKGGGGATANAVNQNAGRQQNSLRAFSSGKQQG